MLEYKRTMDPHSREIYRDGILIGHINWHDGREPRIVLRQIAGQVCHLTFTEMRECLDSNVPRGGIGPGGEE